MNDILMLLFICFRYAYNIIYECAVVLLQVLLTTTVSCRFYHYFVKYRYLLIMVGAYDYILSKNI